MASYPGVASSALGSLLRKVQEDRNAMPHMVPQVAQESSPIREQIQGPLSTPESVGSGKMVAMKPGMEQQTENAVVAPVARPPVSSAMMSPTASPMASVPSSVAPVSRPSLMPSGISAPTSSKSTSSLLPSSMKGAVNGPMTATQMAAAQFNKTGATGKITQGRDISTKTENVINKASTLPSQFSLRAILGRLPLLMPTKTLNDFLKNPFKSMSGNAKKG